MATFDQRGQTVTYQYNGETINFYGVANRAEFAQQIDNASSELARALSLNAIDAASANDALEAINAASANARSQAPEKGRIVGYLEKAGDLVKGAAALGGLYLALTKAAEVAQKLF
ncbi:hypothetical protein [Bradyrhizobium sp. WSM1417]|uniref:hypothetical protein n=1 Tax=Bradyrhizobium sp. WSM1417 TaxID=754500 RepID=UPI000483B3F2|nr:hypothetical protein [Bradyrhizobium sp. WSM1417]